MKLRHTGPSFSALLRFATSLCSALVLVFGVSAQDRFPTKSWSKADPATVGLDSKALGALDADIAAANTDWWTRC